MREFLTFIVFVLAWTAAAGLLLDADLVHPLAIFAVWIVGFVWGVSYIASGKSDADLLTKRWLQMLAGIAALAGFLFLALS